jgi:hypothetical protein
MGKRGRNDPIMKIIYEVFGGTVLKVPNAGVRPLDVVGLCPGGAVSRRGRLSAALVDGEAVEAQLKEAIDPPVRAANVSGKRSSSVEANLGLDILGGLLSGLNLPPAEIKAQFKAARTVSFKFDEVMKEQVDSFELGSVLQGTSINAGNPAMADFQGPDGCQFLVINLVFTSSSFAIRAESERAGELKIDAGAIGKLVGSAQTGVEVRALSETEIAFEGPEQLTFAFTTERLFVDEDGTVRKTSQREQGPIVAMADPSGAPLATAEPSLERVRLTAEPSLLDLRDHPEKSETSV